MIEEKTIPRAREDVLLVLDRIMESNMRPGTADSDVNVFAIEYPVPYGFLWRLRNEIIELRKRPAS